MLDSLLESTGQAIGKVNMKLSGSDDIKMRIPST